MFVIPVRNQSYREELDKINANLCRINSNIPKKSAFQEELDSLRDTVIKQEASIKALQHENYSLLRLTEELLRYIDNIEEVQNSGGVKNSFESIQDFMTPRELRMKTITIPEIKLVIAE